MLLHCLWLQFSYNPSHQCVAASCQWKRKIPIEQDNGNDLQHGFPPRSQSELQVLMHVFAVWGWNSVTRSWITDGVAAHTTPATAVGAAPKAPPARLPACPPVVSGRIVCPLTVCGCFNGKAASEWGQELKVFALVEWVDCDAKRKEKKKNKRKCLGENVAVWIEESDYFRVQKGNRCRILMLLIQLLFISFTILKILFTPHFLFWSVSVLPCLYMLCGVVDGGAERTITANCSP